MLISNYYKTPIIINGVRQYKIDQLLFKIINYNILTHCKWTPQKSKQLHDNIKLAKRS
jgi:hypothetical protein